MANQLTTQYTPDFVFPPGDTIRELVEARRMTQVELAEKLDLSEKAVSQLLNGKISLTQESALKLERVFEVDASFWNNLEAKYQEHLAREEEGERLALEQKFLKRFPYTEMLKRGWICEAVSTAEKVRGLLNFFGVASPAAWERHWGNGRLAAFRKTNAGNTSEAATAVWLRAGEKKAESLVKNIYESVRFRQVLFEIRELVAAPPEAFAAVMIEKCAEAGVALVFLEQLPKTGIAGATRWVHKTPIIQLSLRNKKEDFFWFAFFHEAAHILLHGRTEEFWRGAEGIKNKSFQKKEAQADEFARDFLIPAADWQQFVESRAYFQLANIKSFAQTVDISPGVVVGRLQNEGLLDYKIGNRLRRSLTWESGTPTLSK